MIIHVTIKEDLKIIPIGLGEEIQGAIECTVITIEINNSAPLIKPRNCGVFYFMSIQKHL